MIYINCLLITIIFVIVTDGLHFWDNFSPIISRWMTKGQIKKPIPSKIMTCSTCQSWWSNLVYIIVMGQLSIPMIVYILGLSYMTPVIADLLHFVTETFKTLIIKINSFINE